MSPSTTAPSFQVGDFSWDSHDVTVTGGGTEIDLSGGVTLSGGTWNIDGYLKNYGSLTLDGADVTASHLDNYGSIGLSAGSLTPTGIAINDTGSSFNWGGGTLTLDDAGFGNNGDISISGGTPCVVPDTSSTNWAPSKSPAASTASTSILNVDGTATLDSGGSITLDGGSIYNGAAMLEYPAIFDWNNGTITSTGSAAVTNFDGRCYHRRLRRHRNPGRAHHLHPNPHQQRHPHPRRQHHLHRRQSPQRRRHPQHRRRNRHPHPRRQHP